MAKDQQTNSSSAQINLHKTIMADRGLSRLEVSIFVIGLLCVFVFGAVFLNNQIVQNQAEEMNSRAQSIAKWIMGAHNVRSRKKGLAPERCQRISKPLSTCFQNMLAPGQPFEGLINIYATNQKTTPAFAFIATPRLDAEPASCRDLPSPVFISAPRKSSEGRPENWKGVIIVQPATLLDDLSSVLNSLSVGYCDRNQNLVWVGPSVFF